MSPTIRVHAASKAETEAEEAESKPTEQIFSPSSEESANESSHGLRLPQNEPEKNVDQFNARQREKEDNHIIYPEGGASAWSVVLGSWLACFGSMGIMNSLGIFQAYLEKHQLQSYSSGKIGWVFGLYTFFAFFCGIQVGPIFDARGPRVLIICGGIGTVLFLVLLGFCTTYWHFIVVFGVLGGASLSLVFNPSISIVAHYFCRRRGLATGVASSGASFGGVFFPLVFQHLVSRIGFAWTTRALALVDLVLFVAAVILIRPRRHHSTKSISAIIPDVSVFLKPDLMLASMGIFFMEWGLFAPVTYLTSYAEYHGMGSQFSFLLLSLVNAGAIFGRWIPGYTADRIGRFNTLILTIFGCLLFTACLWMPSGSSKPTITAFAILFGFASGSNVSLAPVCVGQLCSLEKYGQYYAMAYVIVSISTLTGIPIAGAILVKCNGEYWGLIAFAIVSYAVSFVLLCVTKLFCCGWNRFKAVF